MERLYGQVAPWISRAVLAFGALQFGVIGFAYFNEPVLMSWNHGLGMWSATAITMARLQFGALPLAITALALYCICVPRWFLEGIGVLCCLSLITLAGYGLGMNIDGANADTRGLLQAATFDALVYAIGFLVEWRRRLAAVPMVAPDLSLVATR